MEAWGASEMLLVLAPEPTLCYYYMHAPVEFVFGGVLLISVLTTLVLNGELGYN